MNKTIAWAEGTFVNVAEPFTVMLTNEAQQFATDSNRKVTSAQSYYTDIIVIRGSQERTDYTIGNITSGSGITVSKSSKRVTFSVSAGTTIGADTGVIEIPITLDGQTVKKQFSWSCGKQGPQGVQGKDGTSIKITSKSVTYQTSTSGTTTPTGTWSTTVPMVNNGQYLWTKTTVQYSDGNKTEAYSVSYKGTNGTNGTSVTVSKTEVTYQVSTSGTTAPTGTWSTTMPSCDQGQYLWTKTYVKYSDGKETTSYSVSYKGVDGEKFAFNMLRETNQGSKHWVNMGASGKYSVESITTEDSINAVKLICTEPIASNEWQFCDFSDYEMLKSLKASTTYTLSYDIKANRSGKILHNIKTGGGQKVFFANDIACKVLGNETWEHVSLKMTSGTTLPNLDGQVIYMFGDALSKVGYSIIKNLKLTEGIVDTPWAPHPEDLEGRGVSETVQYYLATSQASGVTSSTSGWSTDITTQKLTADKKYLWNCYQTKYSDGTSEPISTPKVIGVYGDKGTSTKIIRTSYEYTQTNIDKFSTSGYSGVWGVNDATTGLKVGDSVLLKVKNTTKGSDCLIFANITAIPSNYSLTCTSYGVIDNGSDGQDGAGFHWNLLKYSGDLSKQVLGGAGTYTATVESIEDKTTPSGQAEKITYTVQGTGGKFIQTGKYIKEGDIKQGKTYTVSVWCKCSSIKSTGVINAEFLDNKTYVNPTLSTEWQQYVVTGVANKDVTSTSSASAISFYYNDNMSVGDIFYISSPKVEEGDKASPWCTTYEETLAKNLTITPSSQYFKSTDGGKTFAPNTITIKPTIQGEISFGKWQYSIDGGVSFADVVSGQKGLAVSNNVLTVSKDSSLYSDAVTMITFRAVADDSSFYDTCSIAKIYDVSDIGDGRNLLWNSNFAKTDEAITGTTNSWGLHTRGTNLVASIDTSTKHNGFNTLKTVSAANGDKNSSNDLEWFAWGISERTSDNLHSKNQNYTLSFYAKASVTTDFIVRWGYDAYGADTTRTLTTNWQKYEIKLHQATSVYSITIIFKLLTAGTVWLSEFKLEKGSSATGYSTAPEDLQTAILSTKSEISDVSLKVDNNKQAIEQRVEKTTYQQDLNLVKGDISKANEGLNKWRYEIYPKSLFASEYQGKSTMDVFAKNTNLTPSQSVLINDTDFGKSWAYGDNYIGYALTFVKFSAAKSIAITFKHDDGAHLYLNGKLIGGDDTCNTGSGESLTLSFIQGWNCLEVVLNEKSGGEYIGLGTTISAISECQLMNCYYGTPVARQSHITNQLVENTTNIDGVSGSVQKVMSTVGGSSKIDEFVNNYSTWKKKVDGIETRVGETYTTKSDFNGLEIGGRNLLKQSSMIGEKLICDGYTSCNNCNIAEYTNEGFHIITPTTGNANNGIAFCFYNFTILGINGGDTITFSCDIKGTSDSHAPFVSIRISDNNWYGSDVIQQNTSVSISSSWQRVSTTITVPTGLSNNHMWLAIHGNYQSDLYIKNFKLEKGNKATDWTPALEDNEINGQNLVSNLPTNWEQGSVQ
nr:MAG TPA: tail protein [Caudoviricetes sp.]